MALMFFGNLTWTSWTSLGLAIGLPCKYLPSLPLSVNFGRAYSSILLDFSAFLEEAGEVNPLKFYFQITGCFNEVALVEMLITIKFLV